MHLTIKCEYDVLFQTARFRLTGFPKGNVPFWKDTINEPIKKNIFLPIKKALESKNNALLNMKSESKTVRYICGLHLKSKELTYDFELLYAYNGDEYKIEEHEDHILVKNVYDLKGTKKYKSYKIKNNACACMSYKMGNSRYGPKNCKHLEFVRNAPIEMEGI